jgi:hypothetical protein
MAKIKFREIRMSKTNKERLEKINSIIEEYQEQDLVLTLRQLYYQLVSRDVIPNVHSEYAKLSTLLKEGRMAGIVDWDAIEDRLRKPYSPASFNGPEEILSAAINQYQRPRQDGQDNYVEVWVEKDALSGVLTRVTKKYHIPIMVNRGYSSASAMFDSFMRFERAHEHGQAITIFYLGDYDPSGIDMIRDIRDRTMEFAAGHFEEDVEDFRFEIIPIALTREQINLYKPPANPAKRKDPRAGKFIKDHGSKSWEVDALRPEVLNEILEQAIVDKIDIDMYEDVISKEEADKTKLKSLKKYL